LLCYSHSFNFRFGFVARTDDGSAVQSRIAASRFREIKNEPQDFERWIVDHGSINQAQGWI
jgi:hypothetical protein